MAAPCEISKRSLSRLQYEEQKETVSETRNILLIVVALITAVTFQAGVNPPGGVWQQDDLNGHRAGKAIYADREHAFNLFLISNTLALSTSILVLICLTYRFPYHLELWIATTAMFVTYASAIFGVAPDETVRFRYVLGAGVLPFGVRFLIQVFYKIRSRLGAF